MKKATDERNATDYKMDATENSMIFINVSPNDVYRVELHGVAVYWVQSNKYILYIEQRSISVDRNACFALNTFNML